ncbi:hypothetical protein VTL71DRAFT_7408 [Oculimacula yallundae]|uniref:Uncharacterized protein n=1 Tax=Oculimacula yallundae TaxID=86028 RepID=A0ABR4BU12_9HELO
MATCCGCWYPPTPPDQRGYYVPKQYLPLLESEVHSTILSTTSRTILKQTFKNPSTTETIKECTYAFPLFDGVSVVSFTCRIGMKVLKGLVKEKVKAKAIFDQAVARGEIAGYLEQAPEASDMFSTKLGNIPAGESVIVEITYIGELKHHETEGIRFTIPTKIAPRYGSGPDYGSSARFLNQAQDAIKIVVDIKMLEGSFIKGVQSPSHPIAVSMGVVSSASAADPAMNKASATLSLGSAALDKDFVLIVHSKDTGNPKAILETHPTISNHRALMVSLVPKFSLPPARPEIVLVADRSGSMRNNIPMLISAMDVFLKSMPTGIKFNVCSFGSRSSFLWEKSQSYTKETLQEAILHVQTFAADMGGTETFGAVEATIRRRWSDLSLEVVLLTDGDIQSQTHLFNYVNQQVEESKGNIRIFPLGIGDGVSHALIEGLARAGNGFSQAVQNGERLDNCVVRMLRGALTPHTTDYTLEVKYGQDDEDFELIEKVTEGFKVMLSGNEEEEVRKTTISLFDTTIDLEDNAIKGGSGTIHLPTILTPKLLQAPHKIPSLYACARTSVYLLMSPETIQRNPTSVVLRATSAHGPLELEIPIEVLTSPAETIHQLAAKKAIQDLEEGRGWIFDAKNQDGALIKDIHPSSFDDLVQREAVRLGEKFQIVGKWCSFVAVGQDDEEVADKSHGVLNEMAGIETGSDGIAAEYRTPGLLQSYGLHQSYGSSPRYRRGRVQNARPVMRGCSQPDTYNRMSRGGPRVLGGEYEQSQQAFGTSSVSMNESSQHPMTRSPSGNSSQQFQLAAFSAIPPPPLSTHNANFGMASNYNITPHSGTNVASQRSMTPRSRGGFNPGTLPASPALALACSGNPHLSGPTSPSPMSDQSNGLLSLGATSASSIATDVASNPYKKMRMTQRKMKSSVEDRNWDTLDTPESLADESFVVPTSISDKVLALIKLQDFAGFWAADEGKESRAFQIIGISSNCTYGADADVWLTVLVIKFLQEKCAEEQGTWELVVEKAQAWVYGCGTMDVEELEKKASLLLG